MFKVINTVISFLAGWEFLKLTFISSWSLASGYDSLSQQHQNFILILRIVLSWTSPLTLLIHLKIYTLYDSFAEGQRLPVKFEWQNYGQRKRKKQKNVNNKTSLSSSIIFSSSPWPFQKQDKDYFKWSVQNDKHQLLVLVVSFGESLYLKEVTH